MDARLFRAALVQILSDPVGVEINQSRRKQRRWTGDRMQLNAGDAPGFELDRAGGDFLAREDDTDVCDFACHSFRTQIVFVSHNQCKS